MNILLTIHHSLSADAGAPGVTVQLARQFEALGHRVSTFSFDNLPARLPEKARMALFPWATAAKLMAIARARNVDVIDASTGDSWLWSAMRRGGAGPLLVVRSHGLEHLHDAAVREEARRRGRKLSWKYPLYHGGIRLREVSASLRQADLALFLNGADRAYATARLGVQPRRTALIRNGIPDYLLGLPLGADRAGAGCEARVAVIGTYLQSKGTVYLAKALNPLLARRSGLRVTFLGTGCAPEQVLADYEARVHNQITVVPRYSHSNLPDLLRGHTVKVLASLSEGFPLAPLEAMACGLAPLVTDVPGPTAYVRDGINGRVVAPRDAGALARALEDLLDDAPLRARLRRAAYATAQQYSWRQVARETLQLYVEARRRTSDR